MIAGKSSINLFQQNNNKPSSTTPANNENQPLRPQIPHSPSKPNINVNNTSKNDIKKKSNK